MGGLWTGDWWTPGRSTRERTSKIELWVTPEEKEALRARATERGITVSDLVREAVL